MSVVEEKWQSTKPSLRERSKFIFNNDLFSDVKFTVRTTDGGSESMQFIPAHKLVLSISSPVFEAMFYGELARLENLLNCLTVTTRVCWSCLVSCTAMKST